MQADEGYMSEDYLDKAQVHNFTPLCPPGERCTDQDWMVKIKDFKPSYQGGGGGGGGATFIFKVAFSTLNMVTVDLTVHVLGGPRGTQEPDPSDNSW